MCVSVCVCPVTLYYYIMIMIEIQYCGTALLLLVNSRTLHQNNGTTLYIPLPAIFTCYTALRITNCLKMTSAIKIQ